jgi:hypothetical protein
MESCCLAEVLNNAIERPPALAAAEERLAALRSHAAALQVRVDETRSLVGDGGPLDPCLILPDQRREMLVILRDFRPRRATTKPRSGVPWLRLQDCGIDIFVV